MSSWVVLGQWRKGNLCSLVQGQFKVLESPTQLGTRLHEDYLFPCKSVCPLRLAIAFLLHVPLPSEAQLVATHERTFLEVTPLHVELLPQEVRSAPSLAVFYWQVEDIFFL